MLRDVAFWAVVALLWGGAVLFGIVAVHLIRTDPGRPWNTRERAVAFKFWFRRWWNEECPAGLYWFTTVLGCLSGVAAVTLVVW